METLSEARERVKASTDLKAYCNDRLTPRGHDKYVCPYCGSGNGPNRSAAFSVRGHRYKCFSCNESGDIFDLAGKLDSTDSHAEQVNLVAAWAGIEGWKSSDRQDSDVVFGWDDIGVAADEQQPKHEDTPKQSKAPDYSVGRERHRAYIEAMQSNIEHPEAVKYLSSRGIDLETAHAWGLGYDPNPKNGWRDTQGAWHRCGRIIIPWAGSDYYHIDRACSNAAKNLKYDKPSAEEVGRQPMWNPAALDANVCFLVEGPLDALAVQQCGFEAIAIGGTNNSDVLAAIKEKTSPALVVLMLDNDPVHIDKDGKERRPGQDSQRKLAEQLEAAKIDYSEANLEDIGFNDAMEAYASDSQCLKASLETWCELAIEHRKQRRADMYAQALKGLHVVDAALVADGICSNDNLIEPISTGFTRLDGVLNGGLQPKNVYVLGGGTSLGKTTWALQVGDHVAEKESRHVLFVNIEQRASELVAKSLSRILATVPDESGRTCEVTVQQLTIAARRRSWESASSHNVVALEVARAYYRERIAPKMHYVEAQEQPTVKDVRTIVDMMAERDGKAPLIIIDYLQLLASEKERESDEKAILKRNMVALRQLAGVYDTPVVVLAALSRDGMFKPMETDSFRDSSNIEYSSDVLMGIQIRNAKKRVGTIEEKKRKFLMAQWTDDEKEKRYRELEVVVLKNRGGEIKNGNDGGVKTTFDAKLSRFSEYGFGED